MFLTSENKLFFKILLPLTLALFVMVNFIWPDKGIRQVTIDGDGRGHYVYLPMIFIQHTVDFKDIFEKEKKERQGFMGHNFHLVNDVYINKFAIGTAVLIMPFFLMAHGVALITGSRADGFSLPYQYGAALAAWFWLMVGLFYLFKLLKRYAVPEKAILFILVALVTATNLFHYAFLEVSFSHVYSFSLIAVFAYHTKKLLEHFSRKNLFFSAIFLGLIILVRQINVLVLLAVPFLADDKNAFFQTVKKLFTKPVNLFLAVSAVIIGFSPQIIINLLQTGLPYIYGYKNEGFDFAHPEWINFLFSFQKGWLVYTPFMIFLIPATFHLFKTSKYRFYTFIFFLTALIFIFSSWWNWFFGDSFGMRPMVDYYAIFSIPLACWVASPDKRIRITVYSATVLLAFLNLFQSYQYHKGIIHVDSMDFKAYRYVFLKTADQYRHIIGPDPEYFYGKLSEPVITTQSDFRQLANGWKNPPANTIFKDSLGDYELINNKTIYGPSYTFKADTLLAGKKLYLKLKARISEMDTNACKKALFILDVKDDSGNRIFYKGFDLKKTPDKVVNKIITVETGIKLPPLQNNYQVKTYIWNKGKLRFKLYSFEVGVDEILPR